MNIRIKKMIFENFKGIKALTIDFNETGNTTISGRNASGKTTVFDGFSWLLWGKDSYNKAVFNIKTIVNGKELHGVEHSVTAVLDVDGKDLTIKKVYKEKYTKKRGALKAEHTGHTTDYFLNEVPLAQKDYNAKIKEVITEDDFRLLANPHHFNQVLDWKERREILLSLVGDKLNLEELKAEYIKKGIELDNYNIDELKKIYSNSASELNKQIESIPIRIDELNKSKAYDIDVDDTELQISAHKKALDDIDKQLATGTAELEAQKKRFAELAKLREEVNRIETSAVKEQMNNSLKLKQAQIEKEQKINTKNSEIEQKEYAIKNAEERLDRCDSELNELRMEWKAVNSESYTGDTNCPTCGQGLPKDQIQAAVDKFNINKATKLESLTKRAENIKAEKDKFVESKVELLNDLITLRDELKEVEAIEDVEVEDAKVSYPPEYEELKMKIKELEDSKEEVVDNSEILATKKELQGELERLQEDINALANNANIEKRTKELLEEEEDLAGKYEEFQGKIFLCENFIKDKVNLISDEVNNLFEGVEFKLFEQQINGGIKETCEATVKGVPYADVNNAGKINAGLEIIKVMQDRLDKKCPVFVDNAESVNKLVDIGSQLVRLVVTEDKELVIS